MHKTKNLVNSTESSKDIIVPCKAQPSKIEGLSNTDIFFNKVRHAIQKQVEPTREEKRKELITEIVDHRIATLETPTIITPTTYRNYLANDNPQQLATLLINSWERI